MRVSERSDALIYGEKNTFLFSETVKRLQDTFFLYDVHKTALNLPAGDDKITVLSLDDCCFSCLHKTRHLLRLKVPQGILT